MGGLMILASVTVATLLWSDLSNAYVWTVLIVTLAYGGIGFYDDYLRIHERQSSGFGGRARLALEFIVAAAAAFVIMMLSVPDLAGTLALPFFKTALIQLGWMFIIVGAVVIVGAGNPINLTDGLDGLAIVPVMIAAATFGLISYLIGNVKFAGYLQIHHVAGTGELRRNLRRADRRRPRLPGSTPPRHDLHGRHRIVGARRRTRHHRRGDEAEVVLAIVGGLFVLETLSVIIQVTSYKLTGKRVFRMAPLHHHYEQKGWQESTVVVRFWIIAVILALVGLATLKLR